MPFDHGNVRTGIFNSENCTAMPVASHASILVDCSNYYRDLYESLMKARHSIFITGWDIDSRIELVRKDEDKNPGAPVTLYELVVQKPREPQPSNIFEQMELCLLHGGNA